MHCAMLADEDLEALQGNTNIVRHGKKIASVRANAQYILDVLPITAVSELSYRVAKRRLCWPVGAP